MHQRLGRRIASFPLILSGGLGLVLLTGCPPDPQIACGGRTGVQIGQPYQATLDARYDDTVTDVLFTPSFATLHPTCGTLDGLTASTTLPFVLTEKHKFVGNCWVNPAEITLPSSVQLTGSAEELIGSYVGTFGLFQKTVSVGGCTGTMEITLDTTMGRPFDPKSPTGYPPFRVTRTFRPDDPASCPSFVGADLDADADVGTRTICGDTWVASLSAL